MKPLALTYLTHLKGNKECISKKGLYDKYKVIKTDGTPIDPKAQYFLLRVDSDPHARKAVRRYATSVFDDDSLLAIALVE